MSGAILGQFKGEVRTLNGIQYKVHHIQAGETLYALSRTYNVSVEDLLKVNPDAQNGLNIGQEILILAAETPAEGINHTVEAGETLFSISKKYNVDIEEIQKMNGMQGVDLKLGQVLKIKTATAPVLPTETDPVPDQAAAGGKTYEVAKGETLYAISRKFGVSVEAIEKLNNIVGGQLSEGQKIVLPGGSTPIESTPSEIASNQSQSETSTKPEQKTESANTAVINTSIEADEKESAQSTTPMPTDKFVEVVEKGVAELIPDTENTRKYLALHRTVKPGTIIRVRNEMNGREVWARVIGTLPSTGENSSILVKVSKAAFDRLGAVDKKFRVTITYIP